MSDSILDPVQRWRLVLGEAAHEGLNCPSLGAHWLRADGALEWLYGREEGQGVPQRDTPREGGSTGTGAMTVPEWINQIHELFPKSTLERLEKDAIERYALTEAVTSKEVLERVEPNPTLLKAVLQTKHLMDPEVLELARRLVRKVVEQLLAKLEVDVERAFRGQKDRRTRSPLRVSSNFDAKRTIRDNLRHVDRTTGKLVVRRPYFISRTKSNRVRWQLILVVDQSGSMLDSTIHAAVTAACFWRLPSLKTHLVVFDTEVVDLTRDCEDPVETLMKVQLGGGTDIAKAMQYAAELIENPRKTIVVLLTDFYEGGSAHRLIATTRAMCEQGTTVLGLAALDSGANPVYDHALAERLAEEGAHVGAMTPDRLAEFVAEVMGT